MLRRPSHRIRSRGRSGFTIVEAVVLISVVGIISAVAAPRFLAMSDMNAIQAQRQALNDLRYAQRLSMHSGCPVQIDFSSGSYVLTQRLSCRSGAFALAIVDPESNSAPFSITLPSGVSITSTVDPLVFDALGRATTSSGMVSDVTLSIGGRPLETVGKTGLVRVP